MAFMILGLILFLGTHSVRMFAPQWRAQIIARIGENPWKGIYSIIAIAGFVLIVWGYGQARLEPVWLWAPPIWTRHLAALFVLPAMILLVAAYIPGSYIKAKLGHPMVLGVKFWAFAHLISNGTQADVILFGSFFVWAIANFAASRRRDRADNIVRASVSAVRDLAAVVAGLVLWAAFAFYLHGLLIGVRPLG